MTKNKNSWLEPLIPLVCIVILTIFFESIYDEYVTHPEKSASPKGSGRLFNLVFYLIDKHVGKAGVYVFLGLLILFFSYQLFRSFKERR